MNKLFSKSLVAGLAIAFVISFCMLWLKDLDVLKRVEFTTLDLRFRLRHTLIPKEPIPQIYLIAVDDNTTDQIGRWPFPRSFHAEILEEMKDLKPSVIAWDILFVDPDQIKENDLQLGDAASHFPHFISGAALIDADNENQRDLSPGLTAPYNRVTGDTSKLLQCSSAQLPIEELKGRSYFGFVNCNPDVDGVRRRIPMIVKLGNQIFPSLALSAVQHHLRATSDQVLIELGTSITIFDEKNQPKVKIPIDESGFLLVNFRFKTNDFSGASYASLVGELGARQQSPEGSYPILEKLKNNSIVFFGITGLGIGDRGPLPLEENSALVTTHLNVVSSILENDYLSNASTLYWFPIYLTTMLGISSLMARWNFLPSLSIALFSIPLYGLISLTLFCRFNLILPTVAPVLGIALLMLCISAKRYMSEEREKLRVKKALGSYLSEKVMHEVLNSPEGVQLGGSKQEISVMFCDIRGFTRYCEKRDPAIVLGVLNEYLEAMTNVIIKYDGTLDKYIGDAIMAFWGAPQHQPDHAQRAVCAAIEMRYALSAFKSKRAGLDQELFECGIGVHTGEAIVGNLGTERLKNYTVIGATVNLAARLEALTKQFNTRIVISEATRQQIEGNFTITELGDILIPGFSESTMLYSVEAAQDITSALNVGRILAQKRTDQQEEVPSEPIWKPVPPPED